MAITAAAVLECMIYVLAAKASLHASRVFLLKCSIVFLLLFLLVLFNCFTISLTKCQFVLLNGCSCDIINIKKKKNKEAMLLARN